jgi:hypothetical protein
MKFTEREFTMIMIGLDRWKYELNPQHRRYTEVENFEQKLHNNKQELVE